MRLLQLFEARKYSYWDLIEHYGLRDKHEGMHDMTLSWINDNRPGNINKMVRDPGYQLISHITLFFDVVLGVNQRMDKVTTPEQFEAALSKPIPLWRGGGAEYDPDYPTKRPWVSFTADESRVKTFSQYDGTQGGSTAGTRLQTRNQSWEVALQLPLGKTLLYLPAGDDTEVIVSTKDAANAQLVESIMLTELQEIGDPSQMTAMELKNQLEDAGWAKIDDGDTAYSHVYGKPGSPWVVKILKTSRIGKTSTRFQCAMQWYRYCLKNWQSNPHLPRIPFVKTLRATAIGDDGQRKIAKGHFSYVVMLERLELFNPAMYEWRREDPVDNAIMFSVMAAVDSLYGKWYNEDDQQRAFTTLLRMFTEQELISLVNKYSRGFFGEHGGGKHEQGSDGWFDSLTNAMLASGGWTEIGMMMSRGIEVAAKQGNKMAIAMLQIHLSSEDNGCEIDLHTGNVMVRPSTDELVITDPVQG